MSGQFVKITNIRRTDDSTLIVSKVTVFNRASAQTMSVRRSDWISLWFGNVLAAGQVLQRPIRLDDSVLGSLSTAAKNSVISLLLELETVRPASRYYLRITDDGAIG